MISISQAIILGLAQGVSELFPVSSLGHSIIIPSLFEWHIDQASPFFLSFVVALHLATALVLFVFFWKDWRSILVGMWKSIVMRKISPDNYSGKLGWLLVAGTIPAGIIGLLFQTKIQAAFAAASVASAILIANGLLLLYAERLRKKAAETKPENHEQTISRLSWWQATKVGFAQVLALVPGFSRSGSTMAGGLLVGLSNEDAARFSFLLATPIIGAAALLKTPSLLKLMHAGGAAVILAGMIAAAIGAYVSVKFLIRYFQTKTLTPFAYYCIGAGIVFLGIFLMR